MKVLGDVDGFMSSQKKRIGDKIGGKIGLARDLPFIYGKEGFQEALKVIENTLRYPSVITGVFKNQNKDDVIDIYSDVTGMIVRLLSDGSFNTLIPQATTAIKSTKDYNSQETKP
jgi:hypothetical protein